MKPWSKLHHQRLEPVFLDQVAEREGAVLAAGERHDAVVVVLAAVLLDQRVERLLARVQSIASSLELVLAADVADAGRVEGDRFVRLRKPALNTASHDFVSKQGSCASMRIVHQRRGSMIAPSSTASAGSCNGPHPDQASRISSSCAAGRRPRRSNEPPAAPWRHRAQPRAVRARAQRTSGAIARSSGPLAEPERQRHLARATTGPARTQSADGSPDPGGSVTARSRWSNALPGSCTTAARIGRARRRHQPANSRMRPARYRCRATIRTRRSKPLRRRRPSGPRRDETTLCAATRPDGP